MNDEPEETQGMPAVEIIAVVVLVLLLGTGALALLFGGG